MTQLLLIRHGQASFGAENYDQLSDLGVAQARAVGAYLSHANLLPTRILSGSLERQKDTAAYAAEAAGISVPSSEHVEFNEYDSSGVFTNFMPTGLETLPEIRYKLTPEDYSLLRDRSIFKRLFFPVMHHWIDGSEAEHAPLESYVDFASRVMSGLDLLNHDGTNDRVALFTSGGVISVLMTRLLGMSDRSSAEFNWRTANASISRWIRSERGWSLESFNHVGHVHHHDLKVTHI